MNLNQVDVSKLPADIRKQYKQLQVMHAEKKIQNKAKNEKVRKENIAMKQILKNLPDKIAKPYFEIWNEYQKNSSQESRLLHDIDKLEMAFQAKFYQNKGIPKEKLQTFFNTAKKEIKSKNLRNILSNFME